MKKQYDNLTEVIKNNLFHKEPSGWQSLFDKISEVKKRGYMTKDEFFEVCMWKSPRPKKKYLSNSEEKIKEISKLVLSTDSEEIKIGLLDTLNGISIPVASAILTLMDPQNYGVIDIRVWQILYLYGEVKTNPSGQGFRIEDWIEYLSILRKYSFQLNLKVRDVEIILFFYHKKIQEGLLYKKKEISV